MRGAQWSSGGPTTCTTMTFRLSTRWANFLNSMLEPRDASLAKGAHWCLTPALCFLEAAGTPLPELSACPSPAAALHCSQSHCFGSGRACRAAIAILFEASSRCRSRQVRQRQQATDGSGRRRRATRATGAVAAERQLARPHGRCDGARVSAAQRWQPAAAVADDWSCDCRLCTF